MQALADYEPSTVFVAMLDDWTPHTIEADTPEDAARIVVAEHSDAEIGEAVAVKLWSEASWKDSFGKDPAIVWITVGTIAERLAVIAQQLLELAEGEDLDSVTVTANYHGSDNTRDAVVWIHSGSAGDTAELIDPRATTRHWLTTEGRGLFRWHRWEDGGVRFMIEERGG